MPLSFLSFSVSAAGNLSVCKHWKQDNEVLMIRFIGRKSKIMSELLDKFRGCLIGAVVGDCLGSPVECKYWDGIDPAKVIKRFSTYKEHGQDAMSSKVYKYTDDTAMARQLANSLIDNQRLDTSDLARRFCSEYYAQPWRGYGQSVTQVFEKLNDMFNGDHSSSADVFKPASEQFDGSGSYGNGSAMRAHPVGVFGDDIDAVKDLAARQGLLTHAHPDGVNGGVFQAVAVHLALIDFPTEEFLASLSKLFPEESYGDRVKSIEKLLKKPHSNKEAIQTLGNDIAAINSVPTAVYCFLRGQDPVEGLSSNAFQRTLELAMGFGGDTDTIMSMAGAMAGARYGRRGIPDDLVKICEGVDDADDQAEKLHKFVMATNVRRTNS